MAPTIILLLDDIRSANNVGSILRSADCFGIKKVVFTGITPHPQYVGDTRLPHVADQAARKIAKTALGAETFVRWEYTADPMQAIREYRRQGYRIAALEQSADSRPLDDYRASGKLLLILGSETVGVNQKLLNCADDILEIGQSGRKESLNVAVAAGVALYALTTQKAAR